MKSLNLLLASLMILVSVSNALADKGGSDRGGADISKCGGLSILANLKTTYQLADLVILEGSAGNPIQDPHRFDGRSLEEIRKGVFDYIDKHVKGDAAQIHAAYAKLSFPDPTDQDLAQLDTGFQYTLLKRIFGGCAKKQLAIQDFNTGIVSTYKPNYDKLSDLEKVLLEIHEVYLRISYDSGERDLRKMETFARRRVFAIYEDLGVPRDSAFHLCTNFSVGFSLRGFSFSSGVECGGPDQEENFLGIENLTLDERHADEEADLYNALRKRDPITPEQIKECIVEIAHHGLSVAQAAHAMMVSDLAKKPDADSQRLARFKFVGLCKMH